MQRAGGYDVHRCEKVHGIFGPFGLLFFAAAQQTLTKNQFRGFIMRRILLASLLLASVAAIHAQPATPSAGTTNAAVMAAEPVTRSKIQAGAEVVKAGALRMEPGMRRSTATAIGSSNKNADTTDASSNTFRMLIAALLLMIAIAVRRYQAGNT
jgi:undecaprenyl pyrophosphate phosphatase UppP